MRGIQALSISHKRLYHTYENLNIRSADKITFNSKFDLFEINKDMTTLKEVIIDIFDLNMDYEQWLKFCFKQPTIEKIKITGIINDDFIYANVPFATLNKLKEVHIALIVQNKYNIDFLLPIVECSNMLEKITFENGILTRETIMEISKSKNLKSLELNNVSILNIPAFRILLT